MRSMISREGSVSRDRGLLALADALSLHIGFDATECRRIASELVARKFIPASSGRSIHRCTLEEAAFFVVALYGRIRGLSIKNCAGFAYSNPSVRADIVAASLPPPRIISMELDRVGFKEVVTFPSGIGLFLSSFCLGN